MFLFWSLLVIVFAFSFIAISYGPLKRFPSKSGLNLRRFAFLFGLGMLLKIEPIYITLDAWFRVINFTWFFSTLLLGASMYFLKEVAYNLLEKENKHSLTVSLLFLLPITLLFITGIANNPAAHPFERIPKTIYGSIANILFYLYAFIMNIAPIRSSYILYYQSSQQPHARLRWSVSIIITVLAATLFFTRITLASFGYYFYSLNPNSPSLTMLVKLSMTLTITSGLGWPVIFLLNKTYLKITEHRLYQKLVRYIQSIKYRHPFQEMMYFSLVVSSLNLTPYTNRLTKADYQENPFDALYQSLIQITDTKISLSKLTSEEIADLYCPPLNTDHINILKKLLDTVDDSNPNFNDLFKSYASIARKFREETNLNPEIFLKHHPNTYLKGKYA